MSWVRTVLYVVAAAGVATSTVLIYRYATHGVGGDRPQDEEEIPDVASTSASSPPVSAATSNALDTQLLATDVSPQTPPPPLLQSDEIIEMDRLVVQEGNMLLSLFGMSFMAIVIIVAFVVAMTSTQNIESVAQIEMFQPLMFIGLGIVAASMINSVNQRNIVSPLPPVLLDKSGAFPDASIDDMPPAGRASARKHDQSSGAAAAPRHRSPSPRRVAFANGSPNTPSSSSSSSSEKPALDALIAHADALYANVQFKELKTYLDENLGHYPTSVELLWRSARACQDLTTETADTETKKELVFEGMKLAERAYEANPNDAMSNKWMGIMISSCGNYRDTSEKIKGAFKIKNFISRAIELNPTDATAHNILGQWCLAFANLSWLEKQAATMLFGRPPAATYDEAVRHFHDAENISPGFWKKNAFLLGDTYAKMKNYEEAKLWLVKAKQIPIKTTEDKDVQKDIDALLAKL
ncbi:Aste57867_16998 [Aphanomyces stellatus]|uniref:Regulator of microtubule dynamics protein 1 n=1 Tax=Aphanomyces stellatus TaxID=120398 RepID=A0A485L8L8_9STRA|nr:hypothetical protein As57867_016940 [Aphanomyces stellatus]VFT93759.1 Aste57867_16998 [Aphanomyces stellatus]